MTQPGCDICDRERRTGFATCGRCAKGIGRPRGICTDCGKPDRLLDYQLRCRWCRDRTNKCCADCQRADTALIRFDAAWVCDRCALRRHLDQVIPPDRVGALHPLRPAILAAEPLTTRRWLDRAHDLLTDLDQERIGLDHAVLDGLPHPKAVEHLRALLISTGILPPDPTGVVRRLERNVDHLLASLNDEHCKIIRRWIRWKVLPRLRRRAEQGHELHLSVRNDRRKIEQAIAFLIGLQGDQRSLAECTQHDIDTWFAGPGAIRWVVRPFLAWSQRHHQLPAGLAFPSSYKGTRTPPADAEERWRIAQELLNNGNLDPVDRVAGALVVLYAQPLARIVTLTTADVIVTGDNVQLRLGPDPLDLPEPLASLIQTLPHKRRDSAAQHLPNPWLFPGNHAGKHLHGHALGTRLRRLGIEPRRLRLAAADQLCREIPPAMLAGVLGLHTATVARATAQTSGQWANYAADRQT